MKKNTTVTNYCHLFFKWIYIDFPNSNSEVPYILKKKEKVAVTSFPNLQFSCLIFSVDAKKTPRLSNVFPCLKAVLKMSGIN